MSIEEQRAHVLKERGRGGERRGEEGREERWHVDMCRYHTNENEVAITMVAVEDQRVEVGVRVRDAKEFSWGAGGGAPKVAVYMEGRLIAVASEEWRGGGGRAGESDSCAETSDEEGLMRT